MTEDEIYEEYVIQNKSTRQIGREYGISAPTVCKYLKKAGISPNKRKRNARDLTDLRFGTLTVIREELSSEKTTAKYVSWLCVCTCGEQCFVPTSQLLRGQRFCPTCRKQDISVRLYKGYEEISKDFFTTIRNGAKRRSLEFSITIEQIWELFIEQDRKCAISDVDLGFNTYNNEYTETTASLDRIDSSLGYVQNNIQWVHKTLNRIKSDLNEEDFIRWCCLVSDNQER
tara:strand:+ start:1189 stop:1875 length:687 start_codon:yes stop_codon:yes gene_type:complete